MNRWVYRITWIGSGLFIGFLFFILAGNYFLNQPVFKTRVEQQVSRILKMPVQFETLRVNWSGVRIKNLTIPYQEKRESFARAKALKLSFSFWHLLRGQIVLNSISLNEPQVNLLETPKGKIELPRFTQKKGAKAKVTPLAEPTSLNLIEKDLSQTSAQSVPAAEDLRPRGRNRLFLDQVKIANGLFQYRDEKQKTRISCEGIQGNGDFLTAPDKIESRGNIEIGEIVIDPQITISDFKSPIFYTNEVLVLADIKANIYRGDLSGFFKARFDKEQKPFRSKLQVRDFDLETFLKERSEEKSIEGRADLNFEGRGKFENTENIEGTGDFVVKSFRAEGVRFFREIGRVLGIPGLSDVTFEQIIGQFHIKDQRVVFDHIETKPKETATYMIGKGAIDFKGNLDFQGAITLNSGLIGGLSQLLQKIQVNKNFGGKITIPFKVTGTTENPKIQVIATDFAEGTLKELFELIPEVRF